MPVEPVMPVSPKGVPDTGAPPHITIFERPNTMNTNENDTLTTSQESLYAIAETFARNGKTKWWWRIDNIDEANEMFETAVTELVSVIGTPTMESARDARLAAVAMIRSFLPGHGMDELAALEPDNLADAKNMLLFLASSYAGLLTANLDTKFVEEALDETARTITKQYLDYAAEQKNTTTEGNDCNE